MKHPPSSLAATHRVTLWAAVLLLSSACSKDKEQCHAIQLATIETYNTYQDLATAAGAGNRADFEKYRSEVSAALGRLEALPVDGDSRKANHARSTKRDLSTHVPTAVAGYEKLLAMVEQDPKLSGAGGKRPSLHQVGQEAVESESKLQVTAKVFGRGEVCN